MFLARYVGKESGVAGAQELQELSGEAHVVVVLAQIGTQAGTPMIP
jgi:hypothetical protein